MNINDYFLFQSEEMGLKLELQNWAKNKNWPNYLLEI